MTWSLMDLLGALSIAAFLVMPWTWLPYLAEIIS